jgi:hypothetical protein
MSAVRADARELKQQVAQIARLLFVHARALGQVWESAEHGSQGNSFWCYKRRATNNWREDTKSLLIRDLTDNGIFDPLAINVISSIEF